jgi:hypothetical protein
MSDNPAMLSPHLCRSFARFMLVWFALALGVAAASPMVQPQSQQLVCTAAGSVKFVNLDGDGAARASGGLQDCPLCVLVGAPPQAMPLLATLPAPVADPVPFAAKTHLAVRSAPPLPPRGPPART